MLMISEKVISQMHYHNAEKKECREMRSFASNKAGRTFILCMERGDFLREQITELCRSNGISNAVVVSGIAALDTVNMQMSNTTGFPIKYDVLRLTGPTELASMDGTIINGEPHIHGVVGKADRTWAGHLLDGCRILYLGEVVIQEIPGIDLVRKPDENGVMLISEK